GSSGRTAGSAATVTLWAGIRNGSRPRPNAGSPSSQTAGVVSRSGGIGGSADRPPPAPLRSSSTLPDGRVGGECCSDRSCGELRFAIRVRFTAYQIRGEARTRRAKNLRQNVRVLEVPPAQPEKPKLRLRSSLMARLILATAEGQQAIELRPINSLGRHPNNSIQLLDKIVSKEHCILEQRDGAFVLRDLGSLNGTYINGERVRGEQVLRHGDEIALGSTRARYDDGSSPLNFAPPAISPGAIQQPAPMQPGMQMPWQAQQPQM